MFLTGTLDNIVPELIDCGHLDVKTLEKSKVTPSAHGSIKQSLELLLLICAVALTRFVFRSHCLYDIDSVNFGLAIDRFDPRTHQPHPPGYFLYVCLGRLFNALLHDPNTSLVAISIAASCATAALIWMLARDWFGSKAATCAGVIFLLSPLAWFHGVVALTYIVEAFFSALVGYLCWRVYTGEFRFIFATGVVLAMAAGIRPSSLLFLAPLYLVSLIRAPRRKSIRGLTVLVLALLAWFIPMIWECGGLYSYFSPLISLWRMVPAKATVFNSSPAISIARFLTIAGIYFLCFGPMALLPLRPVRRSETNNRRKKIFTGIWIAPALLFFSLVFLKFVNSGYLLLLFPPVCVWMGKWASEWCANAPSPKVLKLSMAGVAMAANVLLFLAGPQYCSYAQILRFERELEEIRNALPQVASPRDTLIVGFDSHFLGYRHAGYYLPAYRTIQYPEVRLNEGTRIFEMYHRDTRLVSALPVKYYSKFVLFPLPLGDNEYRDYLKAVRARFDGRELRAATVNGHEFITGSIADLGMLFPVSARAADQRIHTVTADSAPSIQP